jgi:hypothetical protein
LIIDCHGHYTTAPKALEAWRNQQIAGIQDPAVMPKAGEDGHVIAGRIVAPSQTATFRDRIVAFVRQ